MKVIARKFYFVQLSPRDVAFNRAIDRIVTFFDKWIISPLLGKGPIQ